MLAFAADRPHSLRSFGLSLRSSMASIEECLIDSGDVAKRSWFEKRYVNCGACNSLDEKDQIENLYRCNNSFFDNAGVIGDGSKFFLLGIFGDPLSKLLASVRFSDHRCVSLGMS